MGEKVAFETANGISYFTTAILGNMATMVRRFMSLPLKDLVVVNFATGKGYDTSSFSRAIAKSLD